MKKVIAVLLFCLILFTVNAFANNYPELRSWVNDYVEVLSAEEKQELDALLQVFERRTTGQIFVVIMDRIPSGISLEEYVNKLFNHWGVGQREKNNGVLLAVFIQDRKLRIEVGYGFEKSLTNALCKRIIINEIVPGFKEGNFYEGIKKGLKSIIVTIHEEYVFPSDKEVQEQ
jgi:uncharacterized protein